LQTFDITQNALIARYLRQENENGISRKTLLIF